MHLTEQIVDLSGVKAGSVHIIAGGLQISQQIGQSDWLPFTDSLVQRNIERLFILRVFDMNDYTVNLCRTFGDQHLIPLVATHNIAGDFVPDDRIDIPEVVKTAFDLFISRITRFQVFSGVILGGFQPIHADPLQIHLRIHEIPPFSK